MKKLLITAAAFIILGTATVNARTKNTVDPKITTAFAIDFVGAENVQWTKDADFYYASFTLSNKNVTAVYDAENGSYIGFLRISDTDHLPLSIRLTLNRDFEGYKAIGSVAEIGSPDSEAYILSVENDQQILKLKVDVDGNIKTLQKIKKA